jgi:prephenate dehydrogenase
MRLSKLAIIGPGLLGGSIALAMRERLPQMRVAIWSRRAEAAAQVRALGVAEISSTELTPVVEDADVVVLCVPVGAMPALAEKIAPMLASHALVTDVGSVKAPVVSKLGGIFKNHARFVGSHPMAGSERTGIDAASAELFQDAVCIVTPDANSDATAVADAGEFWKLLGCIVRTLPPEEHDEVVALVSHLPHLLAASLVNFVCARHADSLNFCGNGFRDTTRVASGQPEMWAEILRANREPLQKSLRAMIENLNQVLTLLNSDDEEPLRQFLARAKNARDQLRKK